MTSLSGAVWLLARISLVAMFPFSAAEKLWHWRNALAQTNSAGLPGGPALLALAVLVEGLTPCLIVSGWFDRPAALVLAAFCLVTAVLYHPFWRHPDLFSPSAESHGRDHFWEFVKNFGLIGGLILVVFSGTLTDPRRLATPALWSSGFEGGAPAAKDNAPGTPDPDDGRRP